VLAYLATKAQFLEDAHVIEDLVRDAVKNGLGIGVSPNEYASWRNSLGNGMSHIIASPEIPDDAGIAIEYQINKLKNRIDFIVSGKASDGTESIVIIELKQWTEVDYSELPEHVNTFVGQKSAMSSILHTRREATQVC
jgi:hypothetical protein